MAVRPNLGDEDADPTPESVQPALGPVPGKARLGRRARPAYAQFQPIVYYKMTLVGRFYVPSYIPLLLRRDCDVPLCPVAEVRSEVQCYENLGMNLHTPKTSFSGSQGVKVSVVAGLADCCGVAGQSAADVRDGAELVEEIPDAIHDVDDIKHLTRHEADRRKCKIWIDVFKMTLIRTRPVYAVVHFAECLPTATQRLSLIHI